MKRTSTRKLWKLLMRLTFIHCLVSIATLSLASATDNYAQVLETPIQSIVIKDATFEQTIKLIQQKANVKFVYSANTLLIKQTITFEANNITLGFLLSQVFTPIDITFKVYEPERTITLLKVTTEKQKDKPHDPNKDQSMSSGKFPVSGTVVDLKTNSPIAGANILISGTTTGTTSDADGKFTIEVDKGDKLVVSFIGYKSQLAVIDNQTTITITLEEDISALKEVIVNAGYWSVSKEEQTGNISQVNSKEIQSAPVSNSLQAIQGRMAGVFVQQTTGVAGGGFNIRIRGQNSIRNFSNNNGNLPLYVVDGVPFTPTFVGSPNIGNAIAPLASPLSMINPNDIESIEVLKDADATAIYGTRGANGVILITTKRATQKDTQVTVNVQTGIGQVARQMPLLSSSQYNLMRREAFKNEGYLDYLIPDYASIFPDVLLWDTTRNTDWQKELIGRTAHTTNAQVGLSAGTSRTRFTFGGAFYKETTVFPGDFAYLRGSGHLNVDHKSADEKFSATFSTNYSASDNKLPSGDLTSSATTLPPVAPALYDDAGLINWENNTFDNPIALLYRKYQTRSQNFISNATFRYLIVKGLAIKANAGFTTMATNQISTLPIKSNNPTSGITTGQATFGKGSINTWIIEPQIEYEKLVSKHSFKLLAGGTLQASIQQNETIAGSGYTSDALLENVQAAPTVKATGANYSQYKYAGIFARAFYSFNQKYIVNLTGRRDGSSRFGPGNQFANFGAIGAAWLFSNESFIKNALPVISYGKLRSSFGITGSDQIGDYQYLASYSPTAYPYNGSIGLIPNRLVNSNYAWETNQKFEAGIDLGFSRDRFQIGVSWYNNISSNQLVGYPLSTVTGQSSIQYNLDATVQNRGLEVVLQTTNFTNNSFSWNTSLNFTIPKNKLVRYPNIDVSPYANTLEVGKSLYTQKLIHSTGVDQQTGLYSFQDLNGNGETLFDTPGDLQALKQIAQQYYGGLFNSVKYKGLELTFLFQFVKQTGRGYMNSFQAPGAASNQPTVVMGRWQNPGDVTDIQKFSITPDGGGNNYENALFADNAIVDASFIRLKNVSLSWTAPSFVTSKLKLASAKLFINGLNLWTITNFIGLDPETGQSTRTLPPLRMISTGIQLSF